MQQKWDVLFFVEAQAVLFTFSILSTPLETGRVSLCVDIARLDIVIAILFLQYRRKVYGFFTVMAVSVLSLSA